MVEVLEDDQWWDGVVQAQEQREGVWWVHVVYRRNGGQRVDWFPADHVRPDETDYSRGRAAGSDTGRHDGPAAP